MPTPAFSTGNWMRRKEYNMSLFEEQKEQLLTEMAKLHARHELASEMGPDFFEPGMMEYPEQSDGSWDETTGELILRFESKGTRYDGRTEQIEKVKAGDVTRKMPTIRTTSCFLRRRERMSAICRQSSAMLLPLSMTLEPL